MLTGAKKRIAMIKDVDYDPTRHGYIRHISFHAVKANEPVVAEVPIHLVGEGESAAEKAGLIVLQALDKVQVKALPMDLPEAIEISIVGLEKQLHQSTKNAPVLLKSILNQREQIERRTIKNAIRTRTKKILKWYGITLASLLILLTVIVFSFNLMNLGKTLIMASVEIMPMADGKTYEIYHFSNMRRCKINETTTELCQEK
jgi:hypothetical protein